MIIDSHVHIGGNDDEFVMTENAVLEAMDKYGISFSLVSNGEAMEVDGDQNLIPAKDQVSQLSACKRVIDFANAHKDRIGVALWVKPLTEKITDEFIQLIEDHLDVIYAIKLHPYHSKLSPMDEKVRPYLELARKYNLAVVSHTSTKEETLPIHVYEAAQLYPDVNFVMVHLGLGSDNKEALDLLAKADNLYGDTTWVPMETTLEAIKRYGSKKIMFGSDMPIDGIDTYATNLRGERSMYQDYFHKLPELITQEAYEDLMYNNANRVFKIKK